MKKIQWMLKNDSGQSRLVTLEENQTPKRAKGETECSIFLIFDDEIQFEPVDPSQERDKRLGILSDPNVLEALLETALKNKTIAPESLQAVQSALEELRES